jgi:hypothetical protein
MANKQSIKSALKSPIWSNVEIWFQSVFDNFGRFAIPVDNSVSELVCVFHNYSKNTAFLFIFNVAALFGTTKTSATTVVGGKFVQWFLEAPEINDDTFPVVHNACLPIFSPTDMLALVAVDSNDVGYTFGEVLADASVDARHFRMMYSGATTPAASEPPWRNGPTAEGPGIPLFLKATANASPEAGGDTGIKLLWWGSVFPG